MRACPRCGADIVELGPDGGRCLRGCVFDRDELAAVRMPEPGPGTHPDVGTPAPVSPHGHVPVLGAREWTARDLLAANLPAPRWAIAELLPEGLTILAGRPKKGKSWLALALALAVAGGGQALGHFDVPEAGPVLVLALEDGPRRLQDRLRSLLAGMPAPDGLFIYTEWPRLDQGGDAELDAWLRAHPGCRLVILDTYAKLRPPARRGDDAYGTDYAYAGLLKQVAERHHVALLLLHHTRKPGAGGDDPLDEVLGSSGTTGAADAVLVLRSEVGQADAVLYLRGRDLPEAEHALRHDRETGRWHYLGEAGEVRRSPERQAILAALRAAGRGLAPKEIAAATGQRDNNVRRLLQKMRLAGEVIERDGRYSVTGPLQTGNAESGISLRNVTGVTAVTGGSEDAEVQYPGNTGNSGNDGHISAANPVTAPLPGGNGQTPALVRTRGDGRCVDCGSELEPGQTYRCRACMATAYAKLRGQA